MWSSGEGYSQSCPSIISLDAEAFLLTGQQTIGMQTVAAGLLSAHWRATYSNNNMTEIAQKDCLDGNVPLLLAGSKQLPQTLPFCEKYTSPDAKNLFLEHKMGWVYNTYFLTIYDCEVGNHIPHFAVRGLLPSLQFTCLSLIIREYSVVFA